MYIYACGMIYVWGVSERHENELDGAGHWCWLVCCVFVERKILSSCFCRDGGVPLPPFSSSSHTSYEYPNYNNAIKSPSTSDRFTSYHSKSPVDANTDMACKE
jgi:hypothetical protein